MQYRILGPRVVSVDRLVDDLWREEPPGGCSSPATIPQIGIMPMSS